MFKLSRSGGKALATGGRVRNEMVMVKKKEKQEERKKKRREEVRKEWTKRRDERRSEKKREENRKADSEREARGSSKLLCELAVQEPEIVTLPTNCLKTIGRQNLSALCFPTDGRSRQGGRADRKTKRIAEGAIERRNKVGRRTRLSGGGAAGGRERRRRTTTTTT